GSSSSGRCRAAYFLKAGALPLARLTELEAFEAKAPLSRGSDAYGAGPDPLRLDRSYLFGIDEERCSAAGFLDLELHLRGRVNVRHPCRNHSIDAAGVAAQYAGGSVRAQDEEVIKASLTLALKRVEQTCS